MKNTNVWSIYDKERIQKQYGIFITKEQQTEIESMVDGYLKGLKAKEDDYWKSACLSLNQIKSVILGMHKQANRLGNPKLKQSKKNFLAQTSKLGKAENEELQIWIAENGGFDELFVDE